MSLFGGVETPGHPDLANVARLDRLAIPFIRRARRLGIAIDRPYFAELGSRFATEIVSLERDIASYIPADRLNSFADASAAVEEESGSAQFNAGSAEQIGRLLFELLGLGKTVELKRTKNGERISTGKRQLELIKLEHPVVPLILRHREIKKLKTTYCDGLPKRAVFHPRSVGSATCPVCELPHSTDQWRIHGEMGTTRAETGRINHKNPNLGNIPTRTEDGQAVQAGFVAPPGMRLVNRDLSQIELRCLAHLARCQSMIEVYDVGGDMHDDTCRRVFNIPADEKPDKYKHRMAAKRCIAKGQRVLTNRGLVAIEKVSCQDKVWDGVEWVSHEGVVIQGIREVIYHDGLWLTPDHEVYDDFGEKIRADQAKRTGTPIAITGVEENPARYAYDHVREYLSERIRLLMRSCDLLALWAHVLNPNRQHPQRELVNVPMSEEPKVQNGCREASSGSVLLYRATMRESKQSELCGLRRAGNPQSIQEYSRLRAICNKSFAPQRLPEFGYWENSQQRTLRSWKPSVGDPILQRPQHPSQPMDEVQREEDRRNRPSRCADERLPGISIRTETHFSISETWHTVERNTKTESEGSVSKEVEVYDLLNAGPRHRFTVEGKLVANCNFGIQNGTTEKGLYLQLVMDFGASKIPVPDWLTPEWCKAFIASWLNTRPEVRDFFELCWYRARRYGRSWDVFGRCRLIPEVRSWHSWIREAGLRQAQNLPVTSTSAGQLKLAMGSSDALLTQLYESGVWCWPILTIHDAIKVEVEEDEAENVLDALGFVMDSCMDDVETGEHRFRVPITSDGSVESRWGKE